MADYEDPLVGFHFALDFGGVIAGFFTECSGLGSENEVIEHKVVSDGKEIVMKIPGRLKWGKIVLQRGITSNMDIWDWRKDVEQGNVENARRQGAIVMMDSRAEKPVARWEFTRAWPSKVSGPEPKADSNTIALEKLEIECEYMTRAY
jgi:phage tail-like protein